MFSWLSCSDGGEAFVPITSAYNLGDQRFSIEAQMYYVKGARGQSDQLRLEQTIPGQPGPDVIVFLPVQGPGEITGSYLFSKTEDIGTYNLVYVKNNRDDAFDWMTNGDGGAQLSLVYEGVHEGQDIYTLTLEYFDLNFGNWDYIAGKWISKGSTSFSFQYQGVILNMP